MEDLYWGGQGWNSAVEPEEEDKRNLDLPKKNILCDKLKKQLL
jgi:hypothetical protein